MAFIGKVEALRAKKEGDQDALGKESVEEIRRVVEFCVDKYGKGRVRDASVAWVQPEDEGHKKIAQDMITGGEGYRKF